MPLDNVGDEDDDSQDSSEQPVFVGGSNDVLLNASGRMLSIEAESDDSLLLDDAIEDVEF
jgi:hypothetical protein